MTALDGIFGPLTASLLSQFGKAVKYTRQAAAGYDTSSGDGLPGGFWEGEVFAIVEEYDGRSATLGAAAAGDKKLSIAGAGIAMIPAPNDTIEVDDALHRVEAVKAVYSGAEVALWELKCRRGTSGRH